MHCKALCCRVHYEAPYYRVQYEALYRIVHYKAPYYRLQYESLYRRLQGPGPVIRQYEASHKNPQQPYKAWAGLHNPFLAGFLCLAFDM